MGSKPDGGTVRRKRRAHWRWQLCGPGRSIRKRIRVRQSYVLVKRRETTNYELPL